MNHLKLKKIVLAIDQAHEQNSDLLMSDGGAVDLTENPGVLRRWGRGLVLGRWSVNVRIIQTSRIWVSAMQMLQKVTMSKLNVLCNLYINM